MSQANLHLYDTRYKSPCMTVDAAKGTLGLSEDEIVALIEEQGALIAFNIAAPAATKRELRILTQSVLDLQKVGTLSPASQTYPPCYHTMLPPAGAVQAVLDSVHHEKPFITGPEVQRLLICVATHVTNLLDAGALKTISNSTWRRGPGGSAHLCRKSFAAFLHARIVC